MRTLPGVTGISASLPSSFSLPLFYPILHRKGSKNIGELPHQRYLTLGTRLAGAGSGATVWTHEGQHSIAGTAQAFIDDALTTMEPASASQKGILCLNG